MNDAIPRRSWSSRRGHLDPELHVHQTAPIRSDRPIRNVIGLLRRLLGPEITLHLDQIFLKPGRTGMGTAWHQDNAYFKIPQPLRGTAMWIAIHDATVANGTLRVVPASEVRTSRVESARDARQARAKSSRSKEKGATRQNGHDLSPETPVTCLPPWP